MDEAKEFRKRLKRDVFVMLAVIFVTALGIGLTLYYSIKNGW